MSRNISSTRDERNRTERKARYIRIKNLMRQYPDCDYNNLFYCNQLLGHYGPSLGADFSFYHTRRKRYYACALQTLEVKAYSEFEDRSIILSEELFPRSETGLLDDPLRLQRNKAQIQILNDILEPIELSPSIEIKNYGPVAVGLWVAVNKQYVDKNVISEFIAFFRSLGEPVKAGWCWNGEKIEVDPRKLRTKTA